LSASGIVAVGRTLISLKINIPRFQQQHQKNDSVSQGGTFRR
jgi:hypothetical protein